MGGFEKLPIGEDYWKDYEKKREKEFIQKSLNLLKSWINTDPGITKQPKLENGAVVFDYKNYKNISNYVEKGTDWEIVTRKEGNGKYSVRIKKWVNLPNGKEGWQTQKNGNNETFTFSANDRIAFNIQLGTVLDKTIGGNRDRLPGTGRRVYELLNKEEISNNRERNPNTAPEGLRMENGVYVYRVQRGDYRNELIDKLSKYPPLEYLKNGYGYQSASAKSFNVGDYLPDSKFHAGVDLIVPNEKYTKTVPEFRRAQFTAIENMKKNEKYGDKIKNLFKPTRQGGYGLSEKQVANVMTAFARSESSYKARNNYIGECALFRYEPTQVFSYGYHHVLKAGAGKSAFKGLNFTLGDACDPMKSGMLFLAYCIEKRPRDFQKFFDIDKNLNWCCENYNGGNWRQTNPDYDQKLKNNYAHIKGIR